MTDTSLHQIFEAIGTLRAEVSGLRRDIQEGERRAVDSTKRADDHRAAIHKRVDELVEDVGLLATKVSGMESTVSDSKLVTDEVKAWKQRGIGALFVTGIASAAISSTVVGFLVYWWDELMKLLRSA